MATTLGEPFLTAVQSTSSVQNGSFSRSSQRRLAAAVLDEDTDEDRRAHSHSFRVALAAVHFTSVMKLRREWRRRDARASAPDVSRALPITLVGSFTHVLLYSRLNLLLLALPVALLSRALKLSEVWAFIANFVAIVPLAQLLGVATEQVALYSTEVIGGLLNATLGNATEVIISIFAIRAGLLRVVQVSLLGSILSNLLLVLGCSFICGGIRFRVQRYSQKIASINCSLLKMAVLGLVIPTAFVATMHASCSVPCRVERIDEISHGTAIALFIVYLSLLLFQLRTHAYLAEAPNPNEPYPQLEAQRLQGEEEAEDEDVPSMTLTGAIASLALITLLIAVCSESLVDTLELAAKSLHLSDLFIGLVLLPIIGNAAEHSTAVLMAYKGKTDLALGVALGSSIQIALGVIPALVLVAWALGSPLTLDFGAFEAVILLVTALVATSTLDNAGTWLDGVMLISAYAVVAIVYYYKEELPLDVIRGRACACGEACCAAQQP